MTDWADRTRYDQSRYESKRERLLHIVGTSCAICGSSEMLEFDHIDPEDKSFSIMAHWGRPIDELIPELAKCRTLCHSCHKETASYGRPTVEHGGGLSGKKNCKCDLCKARKAEYMRTYSARRRCA